MVLVFVRAKYIDAHARWEVGCSCMIFLQKWKMYWTVSGGTSYQTRYGLFCGSLNFACDVLYIKILRLYALSSLIRGASPFTLKHTLFPQLIVTNRWEPQPVKSGWMQKPGPTIWSLQWSRMLFDSVGSGCGFCPHVHNLYACNFHTSRKTWHYSRKLIHNLYRMYQIGCILILIKYYYYFSLFY